MRFIDIEDLDRSDPTLRSVLNDLNQAGIEVTNEADPERRSKLIEIYRARWVALRPFLSALSHDKCWYLECKNPGTDDDVDHYRPKLAVKEDKKHPGYYWLAFDLYNLRLSCHRANRLRINPDTGETGGKAEHFPLLDEGSRAFGPSDDIDAEKPGLFDPTDPGDPRFISFAPSGEAFLTPKYQDSDNAQKRFEFSRLYLHLNWPAFMDERATLYNVVARHVERGQVAAPRNSYEAGASATFKNAIRDLRRLMAPDAPYSSAAANYIASFRYLWWVDEIVLRGAH